LTRHNPLDQAAESEDNLKWAGLLKSCAAFEAYCKTYTAELQPLRVAEFLLLNPSFPRRDSRLGCPVERSSKVFAAKGNPRLGSAGPDSRGGCPYAISTARCKWRFPGECLESLDFCCWARNARITLF
jgi:hypothetical protein